MKVTYQTIEYDANLPVCIRVRDGPGAAGTGEPHWHKEPELVYIDSGELTVTAGMNHSVLKAGDVRPSQILCKPPIWCRIEAPYWRF